MCNSSDDGTHIQRVIQKLGEVFLMKGIAIKYYNCPYSIHAALEALLSICQLNNIQPNDIEKIEIGSSQFTLNHVGKIHQPKSPFEAQFSMRFTLAMSLLKGPPGMHDYNEATIGDQAIQVLADKIDLYEDALATSEQADNMGSIVTVITRGEKHYEKRVRYAKGTPQNKLSLTEIESKFTQSVSPVLSMERTKLLLETIKNMPCLNIDEITNQWVRTGE